MKNIKFLLIIFLQLSLVQLVTAQTEVQIDENGRAIGAKKSTAQKTQEIGDEKTLDVLVNGSDEDIPGISNTNTLDVSYREGNNYGVDGYEMFADVMAKLAALEVELNHLKMQNEEINELQDLVTELSNRLTDLEEKLTNLPNTNIELRNRASLGQNYPNPYAQKTQVEYFIPAGINSAHVLVHDISGKLIVNKAISQRGNGMVTFHSDDLPKGQYTYSLEVDGMLVDTKKMTITYR